MQYKPADLDEKQLEAIRHLEKQLGVVLVAYNGQPEDRATTPQRAAQHRQPIQVTRPR
ncbi:MAG TPA: hypothetical protein VIL95_07445 [Bacillota bacterium]